MHLWCSLFIEETQTSNLKILKCLFPLSEKELIWMFRLNYFMHNLFQYKQNYPSLGKGIRNPQYILRTRRKLTFWDLKMMNESSKAHSKLLSLICNLKTRS